MLTSLFTKNLRKGLLSRNSKPFMLNKHDSRGLQEMVSSFSPILSGVDVENNDVFDITIPWRTEEIYSVDAAESVNNIFASCSIPQNPWMACNNWNSPHQDSYCSESVGLKGPGSSSDNKQLKLVKQYNPYGFVPTMVCNQHDQMIGISFKNGIYRLITFDNDCNILTSNIVNRPQANSFGGGYFYLNDNNDTIVVHDIDKLACYNTSSKISRTRHNKIGELKRQWTTPGLCELIKKFNKKRGTNIESDGSIYSTLPVWKSDGNKYWVLLPGKFNYDDNNSKTNPVEIDANIVVLEVIYDSNEPDGCLTSVLDIFALNNCYVNNTLSADEDGVYLTTNETTQNSDGVYKTNAGNLVKLKWNESEQKIDVGFMSGYKNCGYHKQGTANIGSGTTPTLFTSVNGNNYVTIGDNDSPQMNIVIYDRDNGRYISETPVFSPMRSADEASFIGVNGRIIAENNFGHDLKNLKRSQYIANEPGMAMINVDDDNTDNIRNDMIWNDDVTCFFAMSMLCRESGIIFAYTCDWNNDESATKGGMFYVSAIDSFDGRIVWKIPIGRGHPYQHLVGGVYFDRTQNRLFVGSYDFLISIQNFDQQ